MISVLVVDDSPTAREAITAILNGAPDISVVGQATDGLEAVELASELQPDVITMDIMMPRMNGYQATKRIMETMPTPIVVVSSVSRQEMIFSGLEVLLVGALDIVQKPGSLSAQEFDSIGGELIEKVKAVSQVTPHQPAVVDGL